MGNCGRKSNKDEQYTKNMFTEEKMIGVGSLGRVLKVRHKRSGKLYALKVMRKALILAQKAGQSVLNERKLLPAVENPFLGQVQSTFQDRHNLYVLMDYLGGGDLRYHLMNKTKFDEDATRFIVLCVAKGLQHLHTRGIIHHDVKPQNIIFQDKGYCRLIDLGVAKQVAGSTDHSTSGTPSYMAPEVLGAQNHSYEVDYYALGVVAYELIMGRRPYSGKTRADILKSILQRQAQVPGDEDLCSPECANFINRMIARRPIDRLGYNCIQDVLDHPWLALDPEQEVLFSNKLLIPPFIPGEIPHSAKVAEEQPSQAERQWQILLKKQQIQAQFRDYDYRRQADMKILSRLDSTCDVNHSLPN